MNAFRRSQLTRISFFSIVFLGALACRESAETAVPRLVKDLESPTPSVRNAACQALATYGPDARDATKPLIRRLYDENIGIRSSAAFALRKIDSPEATAALDSYKK